ncbi:(d)CMP kinase [Aquisalibacillus elongatus]|uniref:Cytidylate kinase n=1 Tax=Aquisalibacillus elongatus TaxID=485577 RepID=A0A3N5CAQ4_9BACI|nr:(d)CMP kinase [Aquisalibacillus elongatus]RPF55755.1 cytidylate kinase [Aquisalibacillus elongatus]
MKIAIDGPAAAGKSTVAKIIAKKLGYVYIDTGAMYRALTLKALQTSTDLEDENSLANLADQIKISFKNVGEIQKVFIDKQNVTDEIRNHDVTNHVSYVAKHKRVREKLVEMQQSLAEEGNVVMDGRDIGTFVLPGAELKIFLIASVEERAERRHKENIEKGFESDLENLKDEIRRRDQIDSEREVAPLIKAEDAVEIDTTSKSIDEVAEQILTLIHSKR